MPFAFTLHLLAPSPTTPLPDAECVRGLVYGLLREGSQEVSAQWHDFEGPKPFTIGPLRRPRRGPEDPPSAQRSLRLVALTNPVGAALLTAAGVLLREGQGVRLGTETYALDLDRGLVRAQREASYAQLLALPPRRSADLRVLSPAAFKSGGDRQVPLPLPDALLRSLITRWNLFSDAGSIPGELAEAVVRAVVLSRHELRTRSLRVGERSAVGFVGQLRLQVLDRSPQVQGAFAALMAYSEFAGIGARGTLGLGQVRLVKGRSRGQG